jgi:hypothetical protein
MIFIAMEITPDSPRSKGPEAGIPPMTVFSAAIDDLFSDPNPTVKAHWRPGGYGKGSDVRMIFRGGDRIGDFGDPTP